MFDSISQLRPSRLVILEIKSRDGSSSMSEGFLEFIRVLNSMSFKELKRNISKVHIVQEKYLFLKFSVFAILNG